MSGCLKHSRAEYNPSIAAASILETERPTPPVQTQADDDARRVHAALAKLPTDFDRAVVRLRFFDGLSLSEISKRLDADDDTVSDRYTAALRLLEGELGAPE